MKITVTDNEGVVFAIHTLDRETALALRTALGHFVCSENEQAEAILDDVRAACQRAAMGIEQ